MNEIEGEQLGPLVLRTGPAGGFTAYLNMNDLRTKGGLRSARRFRLFALAAIPFAAATFASKSAHAQAWLRDRTYQEGIGIRAGDVELHPGVGAEVGFDSNWFVRSHVTGANILNGAPNSPIREAAVLRVTPSFTISSLSAQRLNGENPSFTYRGTVAASYREFIGTEVNDQRNVNLHAFFRGDILPGRPIGLGFFAGYERFVQPSALPAVDASFNRSDVNAGAEVIAIPGGGTLDLRLGYQFYGALYENTNGAAFTNFTHELSFKNRWKFRPRTSIFTETSLSFINYPNAGRSTLLLNNAIPLHTRAGITGLLTNRFSVLAAAGYSGSFVANGASASTSQYDSLNAQLEGTFYLTGAATAGNDPSATTAISTLTVGYNRDVQVGSAQSFANRPTYIFGGGQNTTIGSYTGLDKFYGRLSYLFAGRAVVSLDGYFDVLTLPPVFDGTGTIAPGTQNGFTNFRPGASLFGEYRFADSFGVNATVDYQQTISDVQLPVGNNQVFDLNNRRVQAFLGVRWFM